MNRLKTWSLKIFNLKKTCFSRWTYAIIKLKRLMTPGYSWWGCHLLGGLVFSMSWHSKFTVVEKNDHGFDSRRVLFFPLLNFPAFFIRQPKEAYFYAWWFACLWRNRLNYHRLKKVLAKDLGNDVNEVLGQAPIDLCVIFRLPLLLLLNPPK